MTTIVKVLAAAAAGAMLLATPALAELYSPAGTWTTKAKDSRYEITLCGKGDAMCGRLLWVKRMTKEIEPYVNKTVLDTAARIGNQTWRGVAVIDGNRYRGTLTLLDRDTLHVKACNGAVCGEVQLFRE